MTELRTFPPFAATVNILLSWRTIWLDCWIVADISMQFSFVRKCAFRKQRPFHDWIAR